MGAVALKVHPEPKTVDKEELHAHLEELQPSGAQSRASREESASFRSLFPEERGSANIRVNISNLPIDMEEAELKDRHVANLCRAVHPEFYQDTASTYGKVARGVLQSLEDGLS